MTKPRTEAGLALYQSLQARQSRSAEPISTLPLKGWPFLDAILAIEAEAAAPAAEPVPLTLDALTSLVSEHRYSMTMGRCGCGVRHEAKDQAEHIARAILAAASPDKGEPRAVDWTEAHGTQPAPPNIRLAASPDTRPSETST